jgi:hypothetical protein
MVRRAAFPYTAFVVDLMPIWYRPERLTIRIAVCVLLALSARFCFIEPYEMAIPVRVRACRPDPAWPDRILMRVTAFLYADLVSHPVIGEHLWDPEHLKRVHDDASRPQ